MTLKLNGFNLKVNIFYGKNEIWIPVPDSCYTEDGCEFRTKDAEYRVAFDKEGENGEIG